MSMIQMNELQILNPDAIIEMFSLDLSVVGGPILYFHSGTNNLSQNLVWQGITYVRFPVEVTGFQASNNGPLPRPNMKVSNYMSGVTSLLLLYSDMVGAKLTRKRTLKKYLDAANFVSSVNPTTDPTSAFADDVFYVDRKINESRHHVEFELCSAIDLAGVQLPRRQIIQNSCSWKYKSSECGYVGTAYFDYNDQPVSDASKDSCSKRIEACKLRFGVGQALPFGGFPGSGLIGK